MPGELSDTYAAALQHDMVDPGNATLVGVVRTPTPWFHPQVDENRPELGPPEELLREFERTEEEFKTRGMCESGAHNAAWEELDFADRYREYLNSDPDARGAVRGLVERLRDGEDLWLVCFENTDDKRCHRTLLAERIREQL